ncbi:MAG: hypothetical protein D6679_08580 [Candidatus Hydrogenedentota bacterium]|nr:MAG: hypothetical protein D6679_08580 [Candidatus Hydrogenedentota bacterium]
MARKKKSAGMRANAPKEKLSLTVLLPPLILLILGSVVYVTYKQYGFDTSKVTVKQTKKRVWSGKRTQDNSRRRCPIYARENFGATLNARLRKKDPDEVRFILGPPDTIKNYGLGTEHWSYNFRDATVSLDFGGGYVERASGRKK